MLKHCMAALVSIGQLWKSKGILPTYEITNYSSSLLFRVYYEDGGQHGVELSRVEQQHSSSRVMVEYQ